MNQKVNFFGETPMDFTWFRVLSIWHFLCEKSAAACHFLMRGDPRGAALGSSDSPSWAAPWASWPRVFHYRLWLCLRSREDSPALSHVSPNISIVIWCLSPFSPAYQDWLKMKKRVSVGGVVKGLLYSPSEVSICSMGFALMCTCVNCLSAAHPPSTGFEH